MPRIFISYSIRDSSSATWMRTWLTSQGFEHVFLDFDKRSGIPPGADWEKTLYREIERAHAVVLIVTPNWHASKWCWAEFIQARILGKKILPVIEAPTDERFVSSDIQHLDLIKDREGGLERLSRELIETALDAQGGFELPTGRPPYPGLSAFEEDDAAVYFGRDDDIRRLIETLRAQRVHGGEKLIALLGASGSGKSSLLRAGIIPRLKRDKNAWIVLPPFRPKKRPIDELALSFAIALKSRGDWESLRDRLMHNIDSTLIYVEHELRQSAGANEAQILISIDQGEELFDAAEKSQADQFLRILKTALTDGHPFLAILALRSDSLGALQAVTDRTAPFKEFSLAPLPLARIRQIIEGPARVVGLNVDDELIDQATSDAETEDALPLLAFALRELYEQFGTKGYLRLRDYQALGDNASGLSPLETAVREAAERVVQRAAPSMKQLQALRDAFIPAMVRVNSSGEYARRLTRWDGLPKEAFPLLKKLVTARLLVLNQDGNERVVEVAHEALLRKWPLLKTWLDQEREFLTGKAQLEQELHDYEQIPAIRQKSALLTGLKLERAREWYTQRAHQLSEAERSFIRLSMVHTDTQRRTRLIVAAMAFALISAFAIIARWQWSEAAKARDRALITQSRFLADLSGQHTSAGATTLGMLLALEGLPKSLADPDRPKVTDALAALSRAVHHHRELRILDDHDDIVLHAMFSPDGTRVVTASRDHTARVWDSSTGNKLATLRGHDDAVSYCVFHPDGVRVLTSSRDGTARVWDSLDGTELVRFKGHEGVVLTAHFSADGNRVVTASADNTARIWNTITGEQLFLLKGHTDRVVNAQFTRDGSRVVTVSWDGKGGLWNATNGRLLLEFEGHSGGIYDVDFINDSSRIITASDDGTARIWDTLRAEQMAVLKGHESGVPSAVFDPRGQWVATASWDMTARLWNAETGALHTTLTGHRDAVSNVAFSADGRKIVTISDDGTARVWNAEKGYNLAILNSQSGPVISGVFDCTGTRLVTASSDGTARIWETGNPRILGGHDAGLSSAEFSPDRRYIATAGYDNTARLWDAVNGDEIAVFTGHSEPINNIAFSKDGRRVATSSDDRTARVWNTESGEIEILNEHEQAVRYTTFSDDGMLVVTASSDFTARIWNPIQGKEPRILRGHKDRVNHASFSSTGEWILTASDDKTARVWNTSNGETIAVLVGHEDKVLHAAFSGEGSTVGTASADSTARIWDSETGMLLKVLRGHEKSITHVAFDGSGRRLITASEDSTARVWDVDTGEPLALLTGHRGAVNRAIFTSDNARVITASEDRTARLWELTQGLPLAEFQGHLGAVNWVALSGDGEHVITASQDRTARVWKLPPVGQKLIELARCLVPRQLSREERQQFSLDKGSSTTKCQLNQ